MKSGIFSSCIPRWGFLVRKATPRSSHPRHSTTCRRSSIPSRSFASNAERRRDLLRSRASSTSLSPGPSRLWKIRWQIFKLCGKSSTASFNTPTAPRQVPAITAPVPARARAALREHFEADHVAGPNLAPWSALDPATSRRRGARVEIVSISTTTPRAVARPRALLRGRRRGHGASRSRASESELRALHAPRALVRS